MDRSRLTTTGVMAVLLLAAAWIAGDRESNAQTPAVKKPTISARVASSSSDLKARVEQRAILLDQQERKRLEILDTLEFTPKPFFPRPFPVPRLCLIPPTTAAGDIDPHRSLFVHDRATLDATGSSFTADFSLNRTLTQIASQTAASVPGTTAVSIFRQLWDTQNAAPGVTTGPHCTDNSSTLNGFSITCPRNEGSEASGSDGAVQARIGGYSVLALVNRLDLAHLGWRNCGEHRIIYGKSGGGFAKNFIIFEAVLPNPRPGCREGCLPVAEFWKSLSGIVAPLTRAQQLDTFFYTGLPGFRPVVHVNHYSASGVSSGYGSSGSGQIRTNQFLQVPSFQPWLLKEFKTVIDCGASPCTFTMVPIMVKNNPHGPLWNEDNATAPGPNFRADTVAQLLRLSSSELTKIGYEVNLAHDAGQSMSLPGAGFVDDYRGQMNTASATGFRAALGAGSLTADQIANRAVTQSCAGCHMPSTFGIDVPGSIGTVTTPVGSPVPTVDQWPAVVPAGFVHVDLPIGVQAELAANPAAFGTGQGQIISPALLNFFLPDRKNFLLSQLNSKRCTCQNRFRFLTATMRAKALQIEARIERDFAAQLEALEAKTIDLDSTAEVRSRRAERLLLERDQILAQRDKALITELRRNDITLPADEALDLKPQTMNLKAGVTAKNDPIRASALRVQEVNQILRSEPPRRTVTGTFRPH